MQMGTKTCVLLLWIQTLSFVKCQKCTVQQFKESSDYDLKFDTTVLEPEYPNGKQVRVPCISGYTGFFKLTCVGPHWRTTGSKCQAKRCPLIHPSDKVQVIGDHEEASFGNVIRFSCKSSNQILDGANEIYCNENGEWSGEVPDCKVKTCELELQTERGTTYVFLPGTTLQVKCGQKHWIVDSQTTTADVTCQSNGEWSIRPVCKEVICSDPQENAVDWFSVSWGRRKLDDTARYACRTGYEKPRDTTTATCTRAGWRPDPLCKKTWCSRPDLENARIIWNNRNMYTSHDYLRYTCINGDDRTFTLTCDEGSWTGLESCSGQCERLQDSKLTVNLSMDKDSYKNGEVIEYVCNAHDAGDKNTATCVDGQWNTTVECPGPSGCQKPPNLADGDVKESMKPEYDHNESVEYICQRLYIMEGTGQRTCVNGAWTGEIKCLKPCTVNQGDMDERNIKFVYGGRTKMYAEHADHITFVCKRARQVSSVPLRQQCVDGVMELPTCKDQY